MGRRWEWEYSGELAQVELDRAGASGPKAFVNPG